MRSALSKKAEFLKKSEKFLINLLVFSKFFQDNFKVATLNFFSGGQMFCQNNRNLFPRFGKYWKRLVGMEKYINRIQPE
jgi:hypothetical protein